MPVYADHPFALISSPTFEGRQRSEDFNPDIFERVAGQMACVHNMVVRGLNSIYLQAPHIESTDVPSFVQYSLTWYKLVHLHHSCEESDFFPLIEKLSGEKGIMDGNVDQHHAFRDGLESFHVYFEACKADQTKYDGEKIVTMIDSFGSVLVQHLTEEIPTIVNLKRFGEEKMGCLEGKFGEEGEKNMKEMGLVAGLPWCFSNHDITFEKGTWAEWPPAPGIVKFLSKRVTFWVHRDWWKFASCDRHGRLRPLQMVPKGKAEAH